MIFVWLVGCLLSCLVGWLFCCLLGWLVGWLDGWLVWFGFLRPGLLCGPGWPHPCCVNQAVQEVATVLPSFWGCRHVLWMVLLTIIEDSSRIYWIGVLFAFLSCGISGHNLLIQNSLSSKRYVKIKYYYNTLASLFICKVFYLLQETLKIANPKS